MRITVVKRTDFRIDPAKTDPFEAASAPDVSLLLDSYMRNRRTLRAFLLTRCSSPYDADDLLQDLFVKISNRQSHPQISNPTGYLFSMAANLSTDLARKGAREARAKESEAVYYREAPGFSPSSEDLVLSQQAMEKLADVVNAMPTKRKRVFVMHRLQYKSHREIAEALGISVKMVEKHMSKALKQCRQKLAESASFSAPERNT